MEAPSAAAASSQQMVLSIVYHVWYRTEAENVSLARLRANHQELNLSYNALNADLSHVPSSGPYNFKAVVGNSAVVFQPADASTLPESQVRRVAVTQTFQGLSDVLSYAASHNVTVVAGVTNVFCVPLEKILGEAELESNTCAVAVDSVGGSSALGVMPSFDLGRTMVHEVGHTLGLPHVFTGDCVVHFSDIPAQKLANFDFQLLPTAAGGWTGALDNRQRDCKIQGGDDSFLIVGQTPPYSCSTGCDGPYEMAMNYMDYAVDAHMVMFSQTQSRFMRTFLAGTDVLTVALAATPITISATETQDNKESTVSGATTATTDAAAATDDSTTTAADTTSNLLGLWIALGVVGGLLLSLVVWVVVRKSRSSSSAP